MAIDLEKIKKAKGRTYINVEECPIPICVDDYLEYKKIEDELGISLITYINCCRFRKAVLKSGYELQIMSVAFWGVIGFGKVRGHIQHIKLPFKNYGKTWALTKEDLK